VTSGQLLVIPIRHTTDWFTMTATERTDADQLIRVLQARIRAEDKSVAGFNVGSNCGSVAGQTVDHAHVHLIPRGIGDVPDPRSPKLPLCGTYHTCQVRLTKWLEPQPWLS